jgi:hypothetical protein
MHTVTITGNTTIIVLLCEKAAIVELCFLLLQYGGRQVRSLMAIFSPRMVNTQRIGGALKYYEIVPTLPRIHIINNIFTVQRWYYYMHAGKKVNLGLDNGAPQSTVKPQFWELVCTTRASMKSGFRS